MQSRAAQVRIDNQRSAVRLAHDRLRKIVGNKRLSLGRHRAGDQQRPQLLCTAHLVQARAQGAKLLRTVRRQGGVNKNVHVRIQMPLWVRAMFSQVIESQIAGRMRNQLFGWQSAPSRAIRSGEGWRRQARGRRGRQYSGTRRLHGGPFLFGLFQCFVNTTHGFLSRREEEGTMLASRNRPSSSSRFWSKACVSSVWLVAFGL